MGDPMGGITIGRGVLGLALSACSIIRSVLLALVTEVCFDCTFHATNAGISSAEAVISPSKQLGDPVRNN